MARHRLVSTSALPLSVFARIRRRALTKGVIGGDRRWLVVGGVFWGIRIVRVVLGRQSRVVAVEVLKPGQAIRLESIPAPTRAERKAYKAAR